MLLGIMSHLKHPNLSMETESAGEGRSRREEDEVPKTEHPEDNSPLYPRDSEDIVWGAFHWVRVVVVIEAVVRDVDMSVSWKFGER